MQAAFASVVIAYLLGSIPFGYLLVRAFRGVDVRSSGSHSIGAINVLRVGGPRIAIPTLVLDVGKAVAAVLMASALTRDAWVIASAAFCVMVGHAYSVWFLLREGRFSEGKSVAGALGVLVTLAVLGALPWPNALFPLGVWIAGLFGPRVLAGRWSCVSKATLAATLSLPMAVWSAHPPVPYLALSIAMTVLVLVRHKNNIKRLRAGTEPRVGERPAVMLNSIQHPVGDGRTVMLNSFQHAVRDGRS